MPNPTLTEDLECVWPARFGSWAERAPDPRTLCRSVRAAPWRLRPPTVAQVREVVREAARNRTALYPVSRGNNWGYGSHLPARSGSVVLDLGGLDAIGDLDRESLSVRVEPGVTQGSLFEHLRRHAPDLAFNVTGSGLGTSVLGNALERGIGYGGEKDLDVYALEVLLADGSLVGPSEGRHHKSRAHPAGLSTDGLFFQTNFGIVVGARLRLRVRQEAEDAVIAQGPLEGVIATLKRAYDDGLVRAPTHVAEPGRTQRLGSGLLRELWKRDPTAQEVARCFPERTTFNALVPLHGRRRAVDVAWREIRRTAAPGVRLQRVNERSLARAARLLAMAGARYKAARLLALRPILALSWGVPSDAGLSVLDGYRSGAPDSAGRGAIYGNAVSCVSASEGQRVAAIVRKLWGESAFTWILADGRSMLTIYTLHFDDAAASEAHAANCAIVAELRAAGLPSYRLDINTPSAPGAEAITASLKAALDPAGIISPGRYESPCADA
ncbi:MAG TPA: FAD-dependent oxidoreductase [Opitutaceae bacterium]